MCSLSPWFLFFLVPHRRRRRHHPRPPLSTRPQTEEERNSSEHAENEPSSAAIRVVAVGSPPRTPPAETPSPDTRETPAAVGASEKQDGSGAPIEELSVKAVEGAGTGGGDGNAVVVTVPLESLDPEMYCLTGVSIDGA